MLQGDDIMSVNASQAVGKNTCKQLCIEFATDLFPTASGQSGCFNLLI